MDKTCRKIARTHANIRTTVIAPITNTNKDYPTRITIENDDSSGMVAIDQIRNIDKQRILKVIGKITPHEVKEVKRIMEETYVK